MDMIRILALADTHLGFDFPFRPRIQRRRRGVDFFNNFETTLNLAIDMKVDLIVHGGDIFFRSKVPGRLVDMVFAHFFRVADKGIPIYIVPGNHERSQIPHALFTQHPNLFVFDEPKTFIFRKGEFHVALSGFPNERREIRRKFPKILAQTGWQQSGKETTILCMHQTVDGATTGPGNFTFKYHEDVIDLRDVPDQVTAIITGHMHRHQVIDKTLNGKSLPFSVFYPGSIERTSFAEMEEKKGCLLFEMTRSGNGLGIQKRFDFLTLPVRPMVDLNFNASVAGAEDFEFWINGIIPQLDRDAVVKIRINGQPDSILLELLKAESMRERLPDSMNVSVVLEAPGFS